MNGYIQEFALIAGVLCLLRILTRGLEARWWQTAGFKEGMTNSAFYFFDAAIVLPAVGLLAFYISQWMPGVAAQWLTGLPMWLQFILCVFFSDVAGYWRHRLLHTSALWPSHAVHHSDEHVHWLTLVRIHPIERLVSVAADATMLGVLGFAPDLIVANGMLRHFYGYLEHMDIRYTLGPLRYVFATPHFHRWHHSDEVEATDKNFAVIFSFIDVAFRTFYLPRGVPTQFGAGMPRMGFLNLMAFPFVTIPNQLGMRNTLKPAPPESAAPTVTRSSVPLSTS